MCVDYATSKGAMEIHYEENMYVDYATSKGARVHQQL